MSTPKSRRAAASVLVLALSLLPVNGANAATRRQARPAVSSISLGSAIAVWVKSAVIDTFNKSGIRIDPNGGH